MKYISVHLFYENLNFLLRNAVFPFVELAKEGNMFQSYFFIRYSEGGTHIRLRFLTNEEDKLKAFAKHYFEQFFIENPSKRTYQDDIFYPNNSIQFVDYQPEIERYGGIALIKIAEQHFYYSSELAKELIYTNPLEYYQNYLLGFAMQFQCIMLYAFGFDTKQTQQFFANYYKNWSTVIDKSFFESKQFFALKENLKNDSSKKQMKDFWLGLDEDAEFEETFLQSWFKNNQKIAQSLDIETSKKEQIIDSLIHMTNNRLDVSNIDEVMIAYILKESFETV